MRGRKDCVWPIFRRRIFNFFLQRSTERNSQKTRNDLFLLFARSLSDKIAFLHTCLSFALVRARRSRCEWESKERERERSEVVVGRYAHHKFYFCRETDGLKTNRARKLLNLCDFFSPFFCDNFATKTNHGIVWAMYSVSVSRYFFCFIFSRFLPFKCSFYKYLRLCEWGDFLNAFYRR